jgi:hypothetical protein
LQCAIGSSGGTVSVAVGIPPSISIGEDLDSSPDPILSAMTVVPGIRGGAVICAQFYDPRIGDNELGYAAVPLNVGKLTAR